MTLRLRLGDLFECTDQGGLLVAEGADGELRHVDEVPSGLACACNCAGCGRPMIARKGKVRAHHFAHAAAADGSSCLSAGETALHKYAKEILNRALRITLPDLVVTDGKYREVVVREQEFAFDAATLEKKDGEIVPDVVLHRRDRRLIVEFKVTHACDDEKIARIRFMDVSAIEVDLSAYRDRPLDQIGACILHEAPRHWLHNPREQSARQSLAETRQQDEERQRQQQQRRHEQQRQLIDRLKDRYRHKVPSRNLGHGHQETEIRRLGLGDLVNLPVYGAGCFSVPVAEWQAALILDLVEAEGEYLKETYALARLKRRGWLEPAFQAVPDYVVDKLEPRDRPFAPPIEAIQNYFKKVAGQGLIGGNWDGIWYPKPTLLERLRNGPPSIAVVARRRDQLRWVVEEQLNDLPDAETHGFDFDAWARAKTPAMRQSFTDVTNLGEQQWTTKLAKLAALRANIQRSPHPEMELFGLPLELELQRSLDKERERLRRAAERQELEMKEKEKRSEASRLQHLEQSAYMSLGGEAEEWLCTPSPNLSGLPPIEAAKDRKGYEKAFEVLTCLKRERESGQRAEEARIWLANRRATSISSPQGQICG